MFRKVIYPPESEASRQEMKYDCKKRMKSATKTMLVLGFILLAAVMIRLIDATLIGSLGTKILAGISAVMIVQALNWFFERQQLKKLERSAE